MRFARAAVAGVLLLAVPRLAQGFDYLHIEANEGDSSGGHVAVRFGGKVYHFQHRDGLVRLQRDAWSRFEHRYRTLGNRGIVSLRVEVSPSTDEMLVRAFQRRYIVEEGEADLLQSLDDEVQVLDALVEGSEHSTRAEVRLRGGGFFERAPGSDRSVDARTLSGLRSLVLAERGDSFLERRRRAIADQRRALDLEPRSAIPLPNPKRFPFVEPLVTQRLMALWSAEAALDLLENPHRLRSAVLIELPDSTGVLKSRRVELRETANDLTAALRRLVGGRRADWGYAFLLGAARLVALERSLDAGRWSTLSTMPPNPDVVPLTRRRRRILPELMIEAENDRDAAIDAVLEEKGFDEAGWTELENALTRVAELRRAAAGASVLRVYPAEPLPVGEAGVEVDPPGRGARDRLSAALAEARLREQEYRDRLGALYGYNLISRNCVSEIFRTIDSALSDEGGGERSVAAVSREKLGGYIDPIAHLNFIPFVSARHVRSQFAVSGEVRLPSFRNYRVDRMAEVEPDIVVALRESNVWTSRLYSPNDRDGSFVFFTDRGLFLRPVLGAVNLAAGGLRSLGGLALMPIDRGASLRSGLSGMLFSMPELLFVNLRKGTNDYVPRRLRPPASP